MRTDGISEQAAEDIGKIVYEAAQPGISYDQFCEQCITMAEMLAALPVIASQCGMKKEAEGEKGDGVPGESTLTT